MNESGILVGALALVIVIAALAIALAVARAQARLMRRIFVARVTNEGNVPGRYALWAEPVGNAESADGLTFEFRLNGVKLMPERTETAAHRAAGSAGVIASANRAAGTAASAGHAAGDVLDAIGHLLPGSVGAQVDRLSRQVRAGQAAVDRAERSANRYRRLVSPGAQAAAARLAGERVEETSRPAEQTTLADVTPAGAVQTPPIQPGQSLSIELIVRPLVRHRAHDGWFALCSRALETPDAAPVRVEAGAQFSSLGGFRFFLPYAIIALAAGALVVLLLLSARGV